MRHGPLCRSASATPARLTGDVRSEPGLTARVYVVLLNWNGWQDTITCLESVLRLDYPDYRVVVCDNASGNGSVERIRAWAAGREFAPAATTPLGAMLAQPVDKPLRLVEYDRERAEA